MDWPGYSVQPSHYTLSEQGKQVMEILLRQPSGYGREQLLIVALRLACMTVVAQGEPPASHVSEGSLMLVYLRMAEESLKDDPDA